MNIPYLFGFARWESPLERRVSPLERQTCNLLLTSTVHATSFVEGQDRPYKFQSPACTVHRIMAKFIWLKYFYFFSVCCTCHIHVQYNQNSIIFLDSVWAKLKHFAKGTCKLSFTQKKIWWGQGSQSHLCLENWDVVRVTELTANKIKMI